MEVKAQLNNLRIAPRKVRLVADAIRNKTANEAEAILNFTVKKSSPAMLKLLNSAVSNAKNNFQLDKNNLYISKITVDEGVKLKRWMPRARGRASEIMKRSSHICLILKEIKETNKKVAKKSKAKTEVKEVSSAEAGELKEEKKKAFKNDKAFLKQAKPTVAGAAKKIYRRKSV